MKVKRFTKLALAGVGLAATAATLTTATYAWYVTNSEVTATGVSGQVASAGAGSLYIAANKWDLDNQKYTVGDYQFDLVLNQATKDQQGAWVNDTGVFTFDDLEPQTKKKTAGTYAKAVLGNDAAASAATYNASLKAQTIFKEGTTTGKFEIATGDFDNTTKKYYKMSEALTGSAYKALENAGTVTRESNPVFTYTAAANNADEYYTLVTGELTDASQYFYGTEQTKLQYFADAQSTTYYSDKECTTKATGAYNSRTSYYDTTTEIEIGDWVDADGNLTDGKFVTFAFWLRAEDGGTVNTYVTVDNTTQTQKDQKVQNRNGAGGQPVGSSLYVDAIQALRMSITQQNGDELKYTYTEASSQPTTLAQITAGDYYEESGDTYVKATTYSSTTTYYTRAVNNVTTNDYQLDKISGYTSATSSAVAGGITFTDVSSTNYDAGVYYKNVVGRVAENTTTLTGVSVDANTGGNSWNTITLQAATDTYFEFKIWLEGSDMQCFDSCRGQTFTVDFRFELQQQNNG